MDRNKYFIDKIENNKYVKKGILVHPFCTKHNKYIYDTFSSEIFKVSNFLYELLDKLSEISKKSRIKSLIELSDKYSKEKIIEGLIQIESIQRTDGFFKTIPDTIDIILNKEKGKRKPKFDQLVLEVTQNCNFRCTYCAFSGNYKSERDHHLKNMSVDTAFKAIDFYLKYKTENKPASISFYGGEPLLQKELIKDCLEYVSSKCPVANFSIQTNGYLLDKGFFDYIYRYNINLSVSVDGPEYIHDRCRVLPSGKGTFHRVMDNLYELAKVDRNFFHKKVCICYTIPSLSYINELIEFHEKNSIISKCRIRINKIDSIGLKNSITLSEIVNVNDIYKNQELNFKNYLQRYINGLKKNDTSNLPFENIIFEGGLKRICDRKPLRLKIRAKGPCPIAQFRLFVTVDESLRICEKTYKIPTIGTLSKGIDFKIIQQMEKDYLSKCKPCYSCWAIMLCNICWAKLYNGKDKIDVEYKKRYCDKIREDRSKYLEIYAKINEDSPDAINNLLNTLKLKK